MLRHIAAFVVSAAAVVTTHCVTYREPSAVDLDHQNDSACVSRIYDVRPIERVFTRNYLRIPPAEPHDNLCTDFGNPPHVDPAIPPTTANYDRGFEALIGEFIEPGTWLDNGGSVGRATWFDGRLLITQTRANHMQIRELLEAIEALSSAEHQLEQR